MNIPRTLETGGTDEEVERYLAEFARRIGGRAVRERPREGADPGPSWIVAGGTLLSTNPNTVPWRLRVVRRKDRLEFHGQALRLPWMRRKGARIAAWRQGQLADYLKTRLGGGPPEKFDDGRLREPFAPFGSTPAALSASAAWAAAGLAATMAGAFLGLLVPCLGLMAGTFREIAARVDFAEAAGDLPLPSRAELAAAGFGARLGAAALLALPAAFFLGLLHALALLAGELWPRAARLGQASAAFQAIFLGMAFGPLVPLPLAAAGALLVPASAHAGYTLVWGRRKERVREGKPPRRALVLTGALLALAVMAALVPRPADPESFRDRLALFRDRYLLGHPPGRLLTRFYYAHTLYTADPLKRFFAADPTVPVRARRTARVPPGSPATPLLRRLGFSVREIPPDAPPAGPCDVLQEGTRLRSGGAAVEWDPKSGIQDLVRALDELSLRTFRGGWLRDFSACSWKAVYYAGPPFALAMFVGFCAPMVSVLFRALPGRVAAACLLFCLVSTGGLMLWDYSRQSGTLAWMEEVRASGDAAILARGLEAPSVAVRHEAAHRACTLREGHAALAEALLRTAEDEDPRVRLWAVAALGRTRDPRAFPVLARRLEDPELLVRYRAAEGLGFLGDPRAEDPLRRRMRDGCWYEGLYALQALRRIFPDRF